MPRKRPRRPRRRGPLTSTTPSAQSCALGVVRAELVAQRVADLADRAASPQRLAHRHEQVAVTARRLPNRGQRAFRTVRIALRPHASGPLELTLLGGRIEAMQLDLLLVALREAVDPDDHALAGLDLLLPAERRLLDLVLHESLLDRGDRAAQLVDALDQLPRLRLQLIGQRLDEVGAAERISRICSAG